MRVDARGAHAGGLQAEKYQLIGHISAGLAHELNGPIGISLGFTELARELIDAAGDGGGLSPEAVAKLSEYLGLVESAGLRARQLSRQIWSFAKAEFGAVEDFDLEEAISDAAALAGPALKVAQIEVARRSAEPAPAMCHGDRAMCVVAFVRIFLAAQNALPSGGSVFWDVQARSRGAAFALTAEPWGDSPPRDWEVADWVREIFKDQRGSVEPARLRPMRDEEGSGASRKCWVIEGRMPVSAGASQVSAK